METAVGQLGALYAIWLREVKRALRDRGQLVGGLSRPILWVILLGIGLNPYFRGEVYGETRFVIPYTYLQFIFPAVIVLNILYTSVQSAVSVIWDREFGFLREVLVSPMPRAAILLGKILGGTTVAMFHGALVLPLYFLSSSIFPLDPSLTSAQTRVIYPEWLVTLIELNPLTYAIDALRGAFIHFNQFDPRLGPLVLVAMAAVFFLIALRDFRRV